MSAEVECTLWFLQRDRVRMTPQCEQPEVKLGSKKCTHFIGQPTEKIRDVENMVEVCRRARKARELPLIDDRVPRKS